MLKYLTKFAMDVLPSVVATILGAYIVNHYINTKSDAPTAAMMSPADPSNQKHDSRSLETAKIPEPGVKAKGISERAMIEKSASEGPAEVKPVENKPVENKSLENRPAENKPAEVKPSETASAPAEPRRSPPAPREKAVAKLTPAPVTPPAATANQAPAAEANATPEERRDANDLARAAIERLRGATANSQDANRQSESPRGQDAPRTVGVSPVRPLPPPIAVAAPPADGNVAGSPPYTASIGNDDPNRPTPPADIPSPPPLDLRAAAHEASNARERAKAVAEDMFSAAKSMFHTVLPQ
jgi:hypothetical protein